MRRNITVDKSLVYASEMLRLLAIPIHAVHETKIADEALMLFIHFFRK
jgi:hypothetical protein